MIIKLHKNATTTPAKRHYIQQNKSKPDADLALEVGVSVATVRRWKQRNNVLDRSHRPHKLRTNFSVTEEQAIVVLRTTLFLGLDDLLNVVKMSIKKNCSRSALDRCLRRYGVSRLNQIIPWKKQTIPNFSNKPGHFYIGAIELIDTKPRPFTKFVYYALDYATRYIYAVHTPELSDDYSFRFLDHLLQWSFIRPISIVTYHQFFKPDLKNLSKGHVQAARMLKNRCRQHNIHYHAMQSQIQGKFPVSILTPQTKLSDGGLTQVLSKKIKQYNYYPQRKLNNYSPFDALKSFYQKDPECFYQYPLLENKPIQL